MYTTCSKMCTKTCKRFFSANSQPSSVFTAQPQLMLGERATLHTGAKAQGAHWRKGNVAHESRQLHAKKPHAPSATPLYWRETYGAKLESDNQGEILCTYKKKMWSSLKERRRRRLIGRKRGRGEEGGGEGGGGEEGGEGGGGDDCPCGG